MPSILFWNVQRLGKTTSEKHKTIIKEVVAELSNHFAVSQTFFCEITSDTQLDDINVSKQVTVRRRAKSTRTAQLGYGAFNNQTGQEIPLLNTPVANYSDLTGNDIGYRGGNAFTGQSKRLVASVGVVNGTNLYIYHANSSYKAATMVHWVAANQSDLHGPGNFIVFGDFNCEPGDVDRNLPPNTRSYHGGPTHNVHKTLDRTYDWAIGNVPLDVRAIDVTSWYSQGCCGCLGLFGVKRYNKWDLPDHLPIVISWR